MEKSYYYQLAQTKNYNLSAMARIAKQGRATIRRKFERWGWVKMFVVPEEPQTLILLPPAPPPASAGPVPPVPSAPSASAPYLTPEIQARLHQHEARKNKLKK